jgi:hypothetical protein
VVVTAARGALTPLKPFTLSSSSNTSPTNNNTTTTSTTHQKPNQQTKQNNLQRVPKMSAYWFSKYMWQESARYAEPFYHGLFKLTGSDLKAAQRAFANRV